MAILLFNFNSFFKLINVLNIPLEEFDVVEKQDNGAKSSLIKEINLANDNEIEVFFEILKAVKKLK